MLVDDRSSVVSLPELPLLGVLPGTGGLTRVVDKRHVRRDLADYFATRSEGVGGARAADWRLVDEVVPRPRWDQAVAERAAELAAGPPAPAARRARRGIALTPLAKQRGDDRHRLPVRDRGPGPGGRHGDDHRRGPGAGPAGRPGSIRRRPARRSGRSR